MEPYTEHFLFPSAIYIGKEPTLVTTILGSCVSVCLYDPMLKIGGINHFMLPLWNGNGLASPKYGNIAIERLIEKLILMGALKTMLIAKVFGGGEVVDNQHSQFNVGIRNVQIAIDLLKEIGIPVAGSSLGGKFGRKIVFNTFSGEVMQKYIHRNITP